MITSLRLQNFRTYIDDTFEFNPGVTIIVGPNASGKTNLLEAVYVMARGTSFRVKDVDLIHHNAPWCRLDAEVDSGARAIKLKRSENGLADKQVIINTEKFSRFPSSKTYPVVLFEPNHLQLFHLGPEARRDYVDDLAEQLFSGYAQTRSHYKRVLAQRNKLLKLNPKDIHQQMFVWNIRLSELGGRIAGIRNETIEEINKNLTELYGQLSHAKKSVTGRYISTIPIDQYSSQLLHRLESDVPREIQRGYTLYGPHRDDFIVELGDHDAQETASRGEIRTILLALKILELGLIEKKTGKTPLLLLDDVFSELDGVRRQALTEVIAKHQTFITTTDADIVVQHFLDRCSIIPLGSKISA